MTDQTHGGQIVQDGGFNRFTWMLLAAFGSILLLISAAALSKLSTMNDRIAEQAGDIKVMLTNQGYQGRNVDSLATDIKAIDQRLRAIETRQVENSRAVR